MWQGEEEIRAAVLDYVEGIYDLEPERIRKSVHLDMAKTGFARQPYVELPMTQAELAGVAEKGLKGDGQKSSGVKEVTIFDVLDQTASVRLRACWGIDFMHLAKYDGKWKVKNVMWQTYPPAASLEKLELGYWKIRGLAAPLRMICRYAQREYVDNQLQTIVREDGSFDAGCWFDDSKPKLLPENPILNLPYVKCGGMVVTQSNACLMFLGRLFGLNGGTHTETVKNDQILCQVFDLRNDLMTVVYPFGATTSETFPEAAKAHFSTTAPGHFKKLEGWLAKYGTPFFCGDSPTTSDFHAFEMIDQHITMAKTLGYSASPVADCPKLLEFHQRFLAIPQLQEYFNGPDHKLPINDVMAFVK